ncbi:MAG: NifB/NifX family molybdenum-iron cluster-binding protein [Chloroflexota bacterium]
MKIIISAVAPDLDATLDPRFGRAAHFLIVDDQTLEWEATPNPAAEAAGGAGSQAAQLVARHQPGVVISGAFGPNAFHVLQAAGIRMFRCPDTRTARQALQEYRAGVLSEVITPGPGGRRG